MIRLNKIKSSITINDTRATMTDNESKEIKQKEVYSSTFASATQIIPVSSLKRIVSRYDQLTSKYSAPSLTNNKQAGAAAAPKTHDPSRLVFSHSSSSSHSSMNNNSRNDNIDANENNDPITNDKHFDPNKFQSRDKRSSITEETKASNKRFKSSSSAVAATTSVVTTSSSIRTSIFSQLED